MRSSVTCEIVEYLITRNRLINMHIHHCENLSMESQNNPISLKLKKIEKEFLCLFLLNQNVFYTFPRLNNEKRKTSKFIILIRKNIMEISGK